MAKCVASAIASGNVKVMWAGVERDVHWDSPDGSGVRRERLEEPDAAGEVLWVSTVWYGTAGGA